jgi:hypothetical protein
MNVNLVVLVRCCTMGLFIVDKRYYNVVGIFLTIHPSAGVNPEEESRETGNEKGNLHSS